VQYKFRIRRSLPSPGAEEESTWDGFSPAELDLLNREIVKSRYAPGSVIYNQDDPPGGIFCIEQGYVLMSRTDQLGNETTFGIFGPEETIGHRSFFAADRHIATARTITPCSAYLIQPKTVRALVESNYELAFWFLRTIARDRGPPDGLLLRGNGVHARTRLIRMLLILRDRFAQTDPYGQLIFDLPLSRGEMANMVGVAPETVTRTIRELEERQLAVFQGRRVIVPHPQLLERAGEIDLSL